MKLHDPKNLLLPILLLTCFVYSSCGTIVGNPRKPVAGGDTADGQNPTAVAELPELEYSLPSTVSGVKSGAQSTLMLWGDPTKLARNDSTNLQQTEDDTNDDSGDNEIKNQKWEAKNADGDILRHYMRHSIRTLIGVNIAIRILKRVDALKEKGFYKGLGKEGLASGIIEKLESDADYTHRLLVCHSDKPYLQLKWNSETKKITSTNILRQTFNLPKENQFFTKLEINPGEKRELFVKVSGKPFTLDPKRRGDKHVAAYRIQRLANRNFLYRAVASWYDQKENDEFPVSRYISASSGPLGVGEVAGWASGCPNEFDETNVDGPGWCFGRRINATDSFVKGDLRKAIERLKAVGIEPKSSLEELGFDDNAKCPS